MIIIYSSKSGSSRRYAEDLSQRTGLPCFCCDDEVPVGEQIVFFGWLRNDQIVGLNRVDKGRLKAVCVVGLDEEGRFDRPSVINRNKVSVPIYYLRGWIDRSKLDPLSKGVLLAVAVMMKLQGLNEHNEPIFNVMRQGGSFYDPRYLDSVERFINTSRPNR